MSLILTALALFHPVFPWESGGVWGWVFTLIPLALVALALYLLVKLVKAFFNRR